MKSFTPSFAALAIALLTVPAHATASADRAAELLARRGSIPVKAAGPYVEVGTFRIQVSSKLGQPSAVLADGTWLYADRAIADSEARGTLVVRFDTAGRVNALTLATPAAVAALRAKVAPEKTGAADGA